MLVPLALAPVERDSATVWARGTLPARPTAIRFRWKYRDERLRAGGRGMARIAPPDSLRLDYATALNLATGAGVVVGDSVLWADPSKDFHSLVRAVPMLWAAFGMVRPPADGAATFGLARTDGAVFRFVTGGDTLEYVASAGGPRTLQAEWRRHGAVVARSRTQLDGHAMPASARIDFPEAPARFEVTVVAVDTAAVIPPVLWRSRR